MRTNDINIAYIAIGELHIVTFTNGRYLISMIPSDTASSAMFDPAAIGQRVAYLAHAVVGHFARADRNHPGVHFDTRAITKLQDVANAWHGAENLSSGDFQKRFFDPMTSGATVDTLRKAIGRASKAKSYDDLNAAAKELAIAMSTIGLDRWHGMLGKLAIKAAAKTA